MVRIVRFSVVLLLVLLTGLAYAGPSQDYLEARQSYQRLLKDEAKKKYRHHWEKVFTKLQRFARNYPSHDKAAAAYYLLGQAHENLYEVSRSKQDARQAVTFYQTLTQSYPASSLADDALLYSAQIQCTILRQEQGARANCERILQRYPQGDMRSKAKALLATLPPVAVVAQPAASVAPQAKTSGPIEVRQIRQSTDNQRTRVVIELNDLPDYTVNTLPPSQKNNTSARLYLDLKQVQKHAKLSSQTVNQGNVKKIRVGQNPKATRVVCDLHQVTPYQTFTLTNPARIVIDIANHAGVTLQPAPQTAPLPAAADGDQIAGVLQQAPVDPALQVRLPDVQAKSQGRLRIVVDPGHGGKDPGAIGPGQLYEKDVVLKLAKKLTSRLRTSLKCEVLMTRDRDVYIPLLDRTAYANKVDADLFISIHANASENKKAHGIETFYLNFSKNDKAVAVAARENGMSLQEVGDLELILFDLMANAKINESSRLAAEIQTSLISTLRRKYSNVKDLGVRQGPFHVLLGATMPSVLVEVAFISNSQEAKRLKSSTYRERTAEAIVDGVKKYLKSQNLLAQNR